MFIQSTFEIISNEITAHKESKIYLKMGKYFNVEYCKKCHFDIVERHCVVLTDICFDMCPRCYTVSEKEINVYTFSGDVC